MSPTATADEPKMTETEFLEAQAAHAEAAIHETWNELKATLRETATLEVWARRHPWIVAGTAVAGGFLLATTLMRPKQEPAKSPEEEEEEIERRPTKPQRGSHWVIETLFGLLKPALGQLVTALIAALMGAMSGSLADGAREHEQGQANGNGGLAGEGPVPM